jgi:hypothetical protein
MIEILDQSIRVFLIFADAVVETINGGHTTAVDKAASVFKTSRLLTLIEGVIGLRRNSVEVNSSFTTLSSFF